MSDLELLHAVIKKSGLSARGFAKLVIARDERQVRRWLGGTTLPAELRTWMMHLREIRVSEQFHTVEIVWDGRYDITQEPR